MAFILRVKFELDAFGRVACLPSDEVEDALAKASALQGWNLPPTKLQLYLVSPSGAPEPSASELMTALSSNPLSLGVSLSALGIHSGAWVLARRTTPTFPQAGSPREHFRSLLSAQGVQADEKILSIIAHSGVLSSRVPMCQSAEDALDLYRGASAFPRTETRAILQREEDVIIDGDMAVPGAQTALFFHAFKHGVPHVLKVPTKGSDCVARECALWGEVGGGSLEGGAFLVPVEPLEFKGGSLHRVHISPGRSDVTTLLRCGILMPAYAGTFARFPPPISPPTALALVARMEPTLRYLHARGWVHGDVKPANIFLDYLGGTWLGDFGTSTRLGSPTFSGGTPAFQCCTITPQAAPLRLDLVGLAITLLVQLGLLSTEEAPWGGWSAVAIATALGRVESEELKKVVARLLEE